MGEIAEMMLEGMLCQYCGEYIGDGDGYPTACSGCQDYHGINEFGEEKKPGPKPLRKHMRVKVACPTCGKFISEIGMPQHIEAKHHAKEEADL